VVSHPVYIPYVGIPLHFSTDIIDLLVAKTTIHEVKKYLINIKRVLKKN